MSECWQLAVVMLCTGVICGSIITRIIDKP